MSIRILTGEFFLDNQPNSGKVVVYRSLWVTAILYLVVLLVKEFTDPRSICCAVSARSVATAFNETFYSIGAIFVGVYAAFYSRFSSQWAYLAGLYNQILQTESGPEFNQESINVWWAAFIEDALELHLATKPMFAVLIRHLLKERHGVRNAFIEGVPGGLERVIELEDQVELVYQQSAEKWKKLAEKKPTLKERIEKERAERERAEKERAERERAERERAEKERAEKERAERERAEKERAERERAEKERAKKEHAKKERAEKERAEKELAETD